MSPTRIAFSSHSLDRFTLPYQFFPSQVRTLAIVRTCSDQVELHCYPGTASHEYAYYHLRRAAKSSSYLHSLNCSLHKARRLASERHATLRHPTEVLEDAHVVARKGYLIAAFVQPRKVPPRVHQVQHEQPRLLPLASHLHGHLEEVHLRADDGAPHQGQVHLLPRAPLLGQIGAHRGAVSSIRSRTSSSTGCGRLSDSRCRGSTG